MWGCSVLSRWFFCLLLLELFAPSGATGDIMYDILSMTVSWPSFYIRIKNSTVYWAPYKRSIFKEFWRQFSFYVCILSKLLDIWLCVMLPCMIRKFDEYLFSTFYKFCRSFVLHLCIIAKFVVKVGYNIYKYYPIF